MQVMSVIVCCCWVVATAVAAVLLCKELLDFGGGVCRVAACSLSPSFPG